VIRLILFNIDLLLRETLNANGGGNIDENDTHSRPKDSTNSVGNGGINRKNSHLIMNLP
jgi:hypothetical protein